MPILRYPPVSRTYGEIVDVYGDNIVQMLNGEGDWLFAYPDANIVDRQNQIVGYVCFVGKYAIVSRGRIENYSGALIPSGWCINHYDVLAHNALCDCFNPAKKHYRVLNKFVEEACREAELFDLLKDVG
mgnify:FL=1